MANLKVHVALNTNKFSDSVEFYSALFGKEPVKLKPGYAKFDIDNPGLNLTLNEGVVDSKGALNHLGIQVSSTDDVVALMLFLIVDLQCFLASSEQQQVRMVLKLAFDEHQLLRAFVDVMNPVLYALATSQSELMVLLGNCSGLRNNFRAVQVRRYHLYR